MLETYTTAS